MSDARIIGECDDDKTRAAVQTIVIHRAVPWTTDDDDDDDDGSDKFVVDIFVKRVRTLARARGYTTRLNNPFTGVIRFVTSFYRHVNAPES